MNVPLKMITCVLKLMRFYVKNDGFLAIQSDFSDGTKRCRIEARWRHRQRRSRSMCSRSFQRGRQQC